MNAKNVLFVNICGIIAIVVLSLLSSEVREELRDAGWIMLACLGWTVWCWGAFSVFNLMPLFKTHQRGTIFLLIGALILFVAHAVFVVKVYGLPELAPLMAFIVDYPTCFWIPIAHIDDSTAQYVYCVVGGLWYVMLYLCIWCFVFILRSLAKRRQH